MIKGSETLAITEFTKKEPFKIVIILYLGYNNASAQERILVHTQ